MANSHYARRIVKIDQHSVLAEFDRLVAGMDSVEAAAALLAAAKADVVHSHTIADTTGLQAALDLKADGGHSHSPATVSVSGFMSSADKTKLDGVEAAATADQTAAELLASLLTVDGAASGLDADTLDGIEAAALPRAADGGNSLTIHDTRSVVDSPSHFTTRGIYGDFKYTVDTPGTDTDLYTAQLAISPWSDDSGGGVHAFLFGGDGRVERIFGTRAAGWGSPIRPWDTETRGVLLEGGVLSIDRPVGGAFSQGAASVTGSIKIALPVLWTNTMLKFEVDVFDYLAGGFFTVVAGGYNYLPGSTWAQTSAHIIGGTDINRNFSVRFGHDGTNACVWIGEVTDVWGYPKVLVKNLVAGHAGHTEANWLSGWAITVETVLDTVQINRTKTQLGKWVDGA